MIQIGSIVTDHNGTHPKAIKVLTDLVSHAFSRLIVNCRERFIEQKDPRVGGKCSGKSDSAGFSARQFSHVSVGKVDEIDHLKKLVCASDPVCFGHLGNAQTEFDVLTDGHGGEQVARLRDKADAAFVGGKRCDVDIVNVHSSVSGANDAADGVKQSGFADARWAGDCKCFTGGNDQRKIVNNDCAVECNRKI
mgnify:CR=1 FL=1